MTPAAITPAARRKAGRAETPQSAARTGGRPAAAATATKTAKAPKSTKASKTPNPARGANAPPPPPSRSRGRTPMPHRAPDSGAAERAAAAPGRPRRVSGPLTGRVAAATATSAGTIAVPGVPGVPGVPHTLPRRPSRARPVAPSRPRRSVRSGSRRRSETPLSARALAFVRALADHPLLDRVIRGRAWIPLLGVMLAGIVAMQVEVLKLGASIGRSIQLSSSLQARNEALRASVGSLVDDQRITRLAAKAGMVMPSPSGVGFLAADAGRNTGAVAGNVHQPDSGSFLSLTTSNGSVQTGAASGPTQIADVSSSTGASSGSTSGTSTATSSTSATSTSTSTSTSNTGATTGNTGASTGNTGASTGNTGASTGNTGATTGNSGSTGG